MNKRLKYYLLLLLVLAGCANVQRPPGGPDDEEPPEIINSVPESGTVNFKRNEIKIEFDEYINKASFQKSLAFQPELKTELDWDGKEVNIEIKEELKNDITYLVNLGAEYEDLRGNKPAQSFSLIFSPGNKIDSGEISGVVYGDQVQGKFIFVYKTANMPSDSLNPAIRKPDYKVQLGSNGTFKIMALKDGVYRLFCVDDKNRNLLFDINTEPISTACRDIEVQNSQSKPVTLKAPEYIDILQPKLISAQGLGLRHIRLNFTEPIDTFSLSPKSFKVRDSADKKDYPVSYAYIPSGEEKTVDIITSEKLDSNKTYYVECDLDHPVKDTTGNIISDTMRTAKFYVSKSRKKFRARLLSSPFPDSTLNVPLNKTFDFLFNTPVKTGDLKSTAKLMEAKDSSEVETEKKLINSNILKMKPTDKLKINTLYLIKLNAYNFEAYNDSTLRDSVKFIRFMTKDPRSYGGITGKILVNQPGGLILIAKHDETNQKFRTNVDKESGWNFPSIPAGNYSFTAFRDLNNNGKYDYGYPFPYEHSECFYIIKRSVNVKSRWTVDQIMLYLTNEK